METIIAQDNVSMEPVRIEIEADYDSGPFINLSVKEAATGVVLADLTITDVAAWNRTTAKAGHEFLEILDRKS